MVRKSMVRRHKEGKDKSLRLIFGVILLLVGLSGIGMMGFGMMPMMLYGYGYGIYGYLISLAVALLGAYLVYDGLKED